MEPDETVLTTKKTLDDAIQETAEFLEMDVPDAPRLVRPEEVAHLDVGTETFVNFKEGYVCLPERTTAEALYHESAHWVLFGNGHRYAPQDRFFYGKLFDEIFATLTQMWMTKTSLSVVRTKEELSDRLDGVRTCKEAYVAVAAAYEDAIRKDESKAISLGASLDEAKKNAAACEASTEMLEFAYWHLCLEEGWQCIGAKKCDLEEFHEELRAFHDNLHGKGAHVYSRVVKLLANRGALAHYAFKNKPQKIINGWLAGMQGIDMPLVHVYLEFTAKTAHKLFEDGGIEGWMQQPRFLQR